MNGSIKIQLQHLARRAIVYLRQSSAKQVQQNQESAHNQRALRERLCELGWKAEQVTVIEDDQGQSATQLAGREAFQKLFADVAQGKVGIVVGYEVSRLSRNCADWHQLLDLCALFDTLIGDADGIYHPRDFNDRLLLGLKGTMSSAELHSLRMRLDAGRLSKARRGELSQHLPTGLVREPDGTVLFDPDQSIQDRIRLVFETFREVGTIQKVLTFFARNDLQLPRRQTSGLYAGKVLWKDASAAALGSILKNPAYAGAFAYGRRTAEPTRQIPGRPATGRLRRPQDEWLALIPDVYPAYIRWDEYEANQQRIAQNAQRIQDKLAASQARRSGRALLSGLVRCGKCGHVMHVSYKTNRFQYCCSSARKQYAKRSCQYLSGDKLDGAVTAAFLTAIQPAEIDALEELSQQQAEQHDKLIQHLEQDVRRLEYAAHRAEQQYDSVDPRNRLIAATLEEKWESAMVAVGQAREKLADARRETPKPLKVPPDLRKAFVDVGRRLPELWPRLSCDARKSLLRTLVTQVNLLRESDGRVQIRIVWQGQLVTETSARLRVFSLRDSKIEQRVADRIRELCRQGFNAKWIAEQLNDEGFHPCRGEQFTEIIVTKLKRRFGILSNATQARCGNLPFAYTLPEVARRIDRHPSWISRKIHQGAITIRLDPDYGCYLFPKTQDTIDQITKLKNREIRHVSIPAVHTNG